MKEGLHFLAFKHRIKLELMIKCLRNWTHYYLICYVVNCKNKILDLAIQRAFQQGTSQPFFLLGEYWVDKFSVNKKEMCDVGNIIYLFFRHKLLYCNILYFPLTEEIDSRHVVEVNLILFLHSTTCFILLENITNCKRSEKQFEFLDSSTTFFLPWLYTVFKIEISIIYLWMRFFVLPSTTII